MDWQTKTMEITDIEGGSHALPLDKKITVSMINLEDRRIEETMRALSLAAYMSRGYIIEQISFEESTSEYHYPEQQGPNHLVKE